MKHKPPQIRISQNCWRTIDNELSTPSLQHERVVFALTSSAVIAGRTLILVREVIVPPEGGFTQTHTHGAKWTAKYNLELLNRCLDGRYGLLIIHKHGGSQVQMSWHDLDSAHQLLPRFQADMPQRAHASVVLGHSSADGLVWLPERTESVRDFEFRVLDDHMSTLPLPVCDAGEAQLHAKQALADTATARKLLRATRIAIVGLSGGGSQIATQLAALGFGELIGIEDQRLDPENRLSTDAWNWLDLTMHRKKLSTVKRRISWINPRCRFTGIASRVPEQRTIDALKSSDIIVGCVNNLTARADILEIASRYCIPYIDVGLTIRTADNEPEPARIVAVSGHVFTYVPGGPCLWCCGYLTKGKIEAETGGADRSYLWNRGKNGSKREAFVSPFNGVLANQAACDVLQLVLGYASAGSSLTHKMYDGFSGTLTEWAVSRREDCPHCATGVGIGDPLWS